LVVALQLTHRFIIDGLQVGTATLCQKSLLTGKIKKKNLDSNIQFVSKTCQLASSVP